MISMLIAATTEDGQSLADDEICTFLRMLFPLGADTTMLALGNILSALLNHREQLDLLRSDLERYVQQSSLGRDALGTRGRDAAQVRVPRR